jgi:hypothetical protein
MSATNPKPVTAARALLKTLYNQRRGPTKAEWRAIDEALGATDGRTRLDPSTRRTKRPRAAR